MKKFISLVCALALIAGCMGGALPTAKAAESSGITYYVSTSGKGGNSGLTQAAPLPGLDAVPWDTLLPGDSVLLKKGDTFPGAIRLVDVHGEEGNPVTIGTYGTGDAPVVETRGQGIWLPKTGNVAGNVDGGGKYVSSGVTLYDCSYITVEGLHIVNVPDAMKTNFDNLTNTNANRSGDKLTYSGVGVAATDVGAAEGITLTGITVQGDADAVAVKTDTSTTISDAGVTLGAAVEPRTYTPATPNTTYYVSSLNGSDSNDGTSPETAFYSLHKINELELKPGVKVYLERGSAFENQYLHIEGGGAEGRPIIIDSYGAESAPTPVINTNGAGVWYQNYRRNLDNGGHVVHGYVSSCILLYDVPYIEVKNIAMTNYGRYGETPAADPDLAARGSFDAGTVPGETGYGGSGNGDGNKVGCYQWQPKMNRTGVAGVAQNKGTITHTVLQNLDIENIFGNIINKHVDNGGIYFTVSYPLDESETGIARYDDLRIEGCYLKRVSRWGIAAVHTTYFNQVSNTSAIQDAACQKYGATNVYIGHNYLEEVGGDPITLMHAYEPLVEYNVSQLGGREMSSVAGTPRYINGTYFSQAWDVSAGIWPWKCKTALFEHNECYTMLYGDLGGNGDCQAWDADYGDSTIYQYNYSAGNTGGCVMYCYYQAYNTVFRYNISYQDGVSFKGGNNQGVLDMSSNPNGQVSNNTFIMAQGTPVDRNGHYGSAYVENNIFYNLGSEYDPQWNRNGNLTFNNNLYVGFGSYTCTDPNAKTAGKSDLFADPTFAAAYMAPANDTKNGLNYTDDGIRNWARNWDTDFNMFKLQDTTNAAVNAGVPHNYNGLTQDAEFGVPRVDNDKDFYGNELDDVHDLGAHDTQTAGGTAPVEEGTGNALVSSLYELRGDPKTELHVPFSTNHPMTVEDFAKGLTVSEGASVKVYNGEDEVTSGNVAENMTVKIVAEDGTENETVYTIKNKNNYNHKTDFVGNQQGNVWFHQTRVASTGDLVNLTGFNGGAEGYWTGSNNTCSEYKGAADDDTADRTYDGTGFVFRAPATGKVTVTFPELPQFRYPAKAFVNSFDTHVIIYLNGKQVEGQDYEVPKPTSATAAAQTVNIPDFDLTVAQGDTVEIMVVNVGEFTSAHQSNCADVLFNVAVNYKDEAVTTEPGDTKRPTAPAGLSARNVTVDSAKLTWLASTDNVGVDHYVITVEDTEYSAEGTTYELTDLEPDTVYTVTVQAVDAADNVSAAASVTFRTAKAADTEDPSAPTGGKTVSAKSKSATIAWNASASDDVEGYFVTVDGETITVRNVSQVTLTDLTPDTQYTASVVAFDAAGNESTPLTFTFRTAAPDTTAPTVPGNVRAAQVGKHTATVRWDPSEDNEAVTGYEVKLDDGDEVDAGDTLSYVFEELEGLTDYTAYVRAYDEAGNTSEWESVDFQTTGSSECEVIECYFEVSGSQLKIPYTDANPLTVEELNGGFVLSEDAVAKVYDSEGNEVTGNVTAGMTVKIFAQDGTPNTTNIYTTVQKNTYNSFEDWIENHQGNVWFAQQDNGTAIVNHTKWNTQADNGWIGWGGVASEGYKSVQRSQACGSTTAEQGSGFTFRAPADGNVTIRLFCYQGDSATSHTEDQIKKRESAPAANTIVPYIGIYINGKRVSALDIEVEKDASVVTVTPINGSLAQGDQVSVLAFNKGPYTNTSGNNGVFFTPVVTYKDEVYTPNPKSITLNESEVTLYTNTSDPVKLPHTLQLEATIEPEGATAEVTWSIREADTAVSVSDDGLVTALANGVAVVTATAHTVWGDISADCTVYVRTRIENITVKQGNETVADVNGSLKDLKVYVNENDAEHPKSVSLTTEIFPANPTHSQLNWVQPVGSEDMISVDFTSDNNTRTAIITANGTEVDVGEVTVRVASADHPEVYAAFKVQVFRYLEHNITVEGEAKVGSTLMASTVDLRMASEVLGQLTYQWYQDSVSEENAIPGAADKKYEVDAADIGHKLVVVATIPDGAFYEGELQAETAGEVALMAGPAAPTGLGAVDCTEGDDGQITGLDAGTIYEYKLAEDPDEEGSWTKVENATTIDNLPAGNYQVRIAETDTQEAGKAATVTVLTAAQAATAKELTIGDVEHGSIVPSVTKAQEDDTFTLTVTPEVGYELESLEVSYTDGDGEKHTLTANTDGEYTMPGYDVTVTAAFKIKEFTITHDYGDNATCSLDGDHEHTVEYGETPEITITAKPGYIMPANVTVTYVDENEEEQIFRGYEYIRSAENLRTATLTFTSGITADLKVTAEIPKETLAVGYTLANGLSAPTAGAPRKVEYGAAFDAVLVADDPTVYKLPVGITMTMDGETFTDFTYNNETGAIHIDAEKITGDLMITAEGLDAEVVVKPVTGVSLDESAITVQVGKSVTLTATVRPTNATDRSVVWQSGDTAIATVDEEGVVTGVSEGETTITVTTVDGGKTATCTVTVTKASGGGSGAVVTEPDPEPTTKVKENEDGTTTTTVTEPDGTVTVTTTDENGEVLAEVKVPGTIPETDKRFEDVPVGHWADKAIHQLAAIEVVNGVTDTTYSPVAPMKRGDLATVLYRLSNKPAAGELSFEDVPESKYYAEGIAWAAKVGVVEGFTEEEFQPETVITREQMALMLMRYAKLLGMDTGADAEVLEAYADGSATHAWALSGMAWCVKNGIIEGRSEDTLAPTSNVTRAEVAVMIDRFLGLVK